MKNAIKSESQKTMNALNKLGAASTERLATVTGLPMSAVGFALCRAEEAGKVRLTGAQLWITL